MCSRLDTSWEVEINKASWRFRSVFLSQALDKKTRYLRWNECLGLHFDSMWSKVLFSQIQQKCCMQNQVAIHIHTACVHRCDRGANPYPRVEERGLSLQPNRFQYAAEFKASRDQSHRGRFLTILAFETYFLTFFLKICIFWKKGLMLVSQSES